MCYNNLMRGVKLTGIILYMYPGSRHANKEVVQHGALGERRLAHGSCRVLTSRSYSAHDQRSSIQHTTCTGSIHLSSSLLQP